MNQQQLVGYSCILVCLISVFCFRAIQQRNEKAMLFLKDQTPIATSTNDEVIYVSFLKLNADENSIHTPSSDAVAEPEEEEELLDIDKYVTDLIDVIEKQHGGTVGYVGRCVTVMSSSKQFPSETCDFILTSIWPTKDQFQQFRSTVSKEVWSIHQAQRMKIDSSISAYARNIAVIIAIHGILPMAMRIFKTITGFEYDLDTELELPALQNEEDDISDDAEAQYHHANKMLSIGKTVLHTNISTSKTESAYVWNFMQHGTMSEEDEKLDSKYALKFIQMLTTYRGGPIHDVPIEPADFEEDATFARLAAVYYPSRDFFAKLVRSAWMYETVQNKRAGNDNLSVVTIPYCKQSGEKISHSSTWTKVLHDE